MSISGLFKRLEGKFAWSFLGVLLAAIFGILTLYQTFHENRPSISVDVINEANVLDIYKPVKDLSIFFQGDDIQQKNLNLRIITVRVTNNGQADILQSYYDRDDVWGIQVQNGRIIEVRLTDSNSDYISKNLNPHLTGNENIIQFAKVIFERGKFFTLEILVIHEKGIMPGVIPIGKIAGIDKIVSVRSERTEESSFIDKLIYGSPVVHIVRAIGYFVAFLLLGLAVALFVALGSELIQKVKKAERRKRVRSFMGSAAPEKGSGREKLMDFYVEQGSEGLKRAQRLLEHENNLRRKIESHEKITDLIEKRIDIGRYAEEPIDMQPQSEVRYMVRSPIMQDEVIRFFVDRDVVKLHKEGALNIDKEFIDSLKELTQFLNEHEHK